MKKALACSLTVAVVAMASVASAEALKSGLQPGEKIGAYYVEKCAGNPNDGVDEGEKLCYRCELGNRPVVAIFARSADKELASLMKEVDQFVANNEKAKAASFVNLIGDDADQLRKAGQEVVEASGAKNVAVVVPEDTKNGPASLKLNEKADVTVLIYNKGEIQANHAFAPGELNKMKIKKIVADAGKMVK